MEGGCGTLGGWVRGGVRLGLLALVSRELLHQLGVKLWKAERPRGPGHWSVSVQIQSTTRSVTSLPTVCAMGRVSSTSLVLDELLGLEEPAAGTCAGLPDQCGVPGHVSQRPPR